MKAVDYKLSFKEFANKESLRKRKELAEKLEKLKALATKTFNDFINDINRFSFMVALYEKWCSANRVGDVTLVSHVTESSYFEAEAMYLIKEKFKSEGWKILSVTTENPDSMDNQGNVVFTIELPSGFWEGVEKP